MRRMPDRALRKGTPRQSSREVLACSALRRRGHSYRRQSSSTAPASLLAGLRNQGVDLFPVQPVEAPRLALSANSTQCLKSPRATERLETLLERVPVDSEHQGDWPTVGCQKRFSFFGDRLSGLPRPRTEVSDRERLHGPECNIPGDNCHPHRWRNRYSYMNASGATRSREPPGEMVPRWYGEGSPSRNRRSIPLRRSGSRGRSG